MIKLMPHQVDVLAATADKNKVAYYLDMGLGKTYVGSEKAISLGKNILVICQKSKVQDWIEHFEKNYPDYNVRDLTRIKATENAKIYIYASFNIKVTTKYLKVYIINYELAWRRKELSQFEDFTLMLDESSLIQNETTKQAKFILKELNPTNVILLSGTPVNGKYEQLWSQCHLLGWPISKKLFYRQYLTYELDNEGYPRISGYKNVERLKAKLRSYGAVFMKTEEVITLPAQTFTTIKVDETKEYKYFKKHGLIEVEGTQLVGDTTLTQRLYERMLCSQFNKAKLEAFTDLLESTNDRIIVFYNFYEELTRLEDIAIKLDKPVSIINGKEKDLSCYEEYDNSVTFIQYQSGSRGGNYQKANIIIYFSPTESCEMFDQSKKRIHRIGQEKPCFYYLLKSGIDYRIYNALALGKDYTDELFKEDKKNEEAK